MNMKFISVLLLVFTTSLTVSCKNTKTKSTAKVTKKSHLVKKSQMIAPKKIIIQAKKELMKKQVLEEETKKHEQVADAEDARPKKMPCVIPNGDGVKALKGDQYGKCMLTSCQPGFVKYKNSCTPVCREDEAFHKGTCNQVIAQCQVNNREGEKIWDGDHYGPCIDADEFSISANHSTIE